MEKVSGETIIENLNWRYAVKRFDPSKKVSEEDWKILEQAIHLSASSSGLQPWKFIVITSPEMKKKLTPVSYNQRQIEECSHLVVFAHARKVDESYIARYIKRISEVRGVSEESLEGFRQSMIASIVKGPIKDKMEPWTARQTYIAIGTLLTAAAMMRIDACPMEGFLPAKYDEILSLEGTNYKSVALVAIGYRSAEDSFQNLKKVRFDREEVITRV